MRISAVAVEERQSGRAPARLADYFELSKVGLTMLVAFTAAVGFVLSRRADPGADGPFPWTTLLLVGLGTYLTASGATAMNQAWERDRDARMRRTRERPVPTGRIPAARAVIFSATCASIGIAILGCSTNALVAALGLVNYIVYILAYTPLKPKTPLCTLVGAICGAIPPLMGWAAAAGRLDLGGYILAAILFVWQIPHFLALAWLYRADYEQGGFRVLSAVDPDGGLTARFAVLYSLASILLVGASALAGMGGAGFFVAGTGLGVWMLVLGIRLMIRRTDARARALFVASLVYLPIVLVLLLVDGGRTVWTLAGR